MPDAPPSQLSVDPPPAECHHLTGPTGVGKSYVACALAHKACLENFKTRYYRLPRLLEAPQTAREEGTHLEALKQLVRLDVLVLDDWGLHRIDPRQQRHVMELLDDRYTVRSTIAASQYPLDKWYETMEDPTVAHFNRIAGSLRPELVAHLVGIRN